MEVASLVAPAVFVRLGMSASISTAFLLGLRLARMALGQESTDSIESQDAEALASLLAHMKPEHCDARQYTVVCATAWTDCKRFAGIHPNHSFLAHAHPASRADLDPPRGYHVQDGKFYRVW